MRAPVEYIDESVEMNTTYDYRVVAKNKFDLSEPSNIVTVTTPLGIEKTMLKLFPNPVQDNLTIEVERNYYGNFLIIDLAGQTVIEGKLDKPSNDINLSSLKSGVYYFVQKNNYSSITKKLLKR